MLSTYETYCDIRALTIGKKMFLSYGSASQVKRDPQTYGRWLHGAFVAEIVCKSPHFVAFCNNYHSKIKDPPRLQR